MFAREGPHRGSVCRRSAASSQVLFLLEKNLTYRCAWHPHLAENWMPLHLLAVRSALTFLSESCAWLLAVTSEPRSSPHSVCVVTRALATELLLSPHLLHVDGTLLFWSPCACSPVRGTGAATLRAPLTW